MRVKQNILSLILPVFVIIGLMFLTGCEEDEGVVTPDPQGAEQLVDEANAAMDTLLYELINNEPEEISDVDFSVPYNLYRQALEKDAENLDANFGAGLCGMMMLSQNQEFQDVWEEWMDLLDPEGENPPQIGIPFSAESYGLPVDLIPETVRGLCLVQQNEFPSIGRFQNLIRNVIIPRLGYALERLSYVAENDNYVFIVTPMMQGDPGEDPIEIDKTEVCAALVPLYLTRGLLRNSIAYDWDIDPTDSSDMVSSLSQNGSFMRLVSDGASQLSNSRSDFLSAGDYLEEGINFLCSETDDQSDDAIVVDEDELHQADLDTILSYLDDFRQALNDAYVFTADFDVDPVTPDQDLTIYLPAYFNGGISNFKALLPPYSISVEYELFSRVESYHNYHSLDAEVNVIDEGWYEYYYSITYYGSGQPEYEQWGNVSAPGFDAAVDSVWNEYQNRQDLEYFNANIYWYNYLPAGSTIVSATLYIYYDLTVSELGIWLPALTWDANSFAEWILPDPTMGEILPEITNDAHFKSFFGLDEDDWQKTISIGG